MPVLIKCPHCPARLAVPDEAVGKTVRCPKCQTVLTTQPPTQPIQSELLTAELLPLPEENRSRSPIEVDGSTASVLGLIDEPQLPTVAPSRAGRKRKKRSTRRSRWLPRVALGSMHMSWSLPVFGTLLLFLAAGLGLYLGVKESKPKGISAEQWETVELTGRFRARLPCKHEQGSCTTLGLNLELYVCEPTSTSLFVVGLTQYELLPDRTVRESGRRLEEVCTAALRRMAGHRWKETHREAIPGTHECRQLVVSIDDQRSPVPTSILPGGYLTSWSDRRSLWPAGGQGVAIIRFYLAHNRVFVLLAAGKEIDLKHPDVKYLFDSFEIMDSSAKTVVSP